MDVTFNILILFLWFVFPGIIFRRFYYTGPFSDEFGISSFSSIIIMSVVPSILLQVGFYLYVISLTKLNVDFSQVVNLYFSENTASFNNSLTSIKNNIGIILLYHFGFWTLSALLGSLAFGIVRQLKLDRKTSLLRFNNDWHYLITGEIVDILYEDYSSEDIVFTIVDVLMDDKNMPVLYSGFLFHYKLNPGGKGIEYICLSSAVSRKFQSNSQKIDESSVTEIPGDLFVIQASQILNMNFKYFRAEEE